MFVKNFVKEWFPRLFLCLRVRKLLAGKVDPDMVFLATLREVMSASPEARNFVSYLSKANTAIDVGGCGGEYAYIMARMFKEVVSIEPTPEMAAKLRVALPTNCKVLECALGRVPCDVYLRIPRVGDARMHALSTVANHDFAFSDIGVVDSVKVRQTTIDELVKETGLKPAFIKIDVEGYEGEVLEGATATIESLRPILLIEIEKRHNKKFHEIFVLLSSYGYVPYHFRSGKLERSGAASVDTSYDVLLANGISGMAGVIASRAADKYINNFLFLPNR